MVDLKISSSGIIKGIELVIFDKDGTLVQLYHYWSQMVSLRAKTICQKLGLNNGCEKRLIYEMGVDLENGSIRQEGPVGIQKREVVLKAATDYLSSVEHRGSFNLCLEAFEEADRLSLLRSGNFVKPVAGAYYFINSLYDNKCKIAVATADRSERARLAMELLGFQEKIDTIVGAELLSRTKPYPEAIYRIVDKLKVNKSNVVMIGDTVADVQMGINAKVKASIGVSTGLASPKQLRKITPYVVGNLTEIKVCK